MNVLMNFFKSLWYTIISLISISFIIEKCIQFLKKIINTYTTSGEVLKQFSIITISIFIFFFMFVSMACLCFIFKALYNLWLFFYYSLLCTYSYSRVQINVDENNIIKDSYIEFSNGDKVPLDITKIVSNVTDENNAQDNNNEGE